MCAKNPDSKTYFFIEDKSGERVRVPEDIFPEVFLGQSFGIITDFEPTCSHFKYSMELRVPHSARKFIGCNLTVTHSVDDKKVIFHGDASGEDGYHGFYWSIKGDDPVGVYEMLYSINGRTLGAFKFKVLKFSIVSFLLNCTTRSILTTNVPKVEQ